MEPGSLLISPRKQEAEFRNSMSMPAIHRHPLRWSRELNQGISGWPSKSTRATVCHKANRHSPCSGSRSATDCGDHRDGELLSNRNATLRLNGPYKATAFSTLPVALNSCFASLIASTHSAADDSLPLPADEPAFFAPP